MLYESTNYQEEEEEKHECDAQCARNVRITDTLPVIEDPLMWLKGLTAHLNAVASDQFTGTSIIEGNGIKTHSRRMLDTARQICQYTLLYIRTSTFGHEARLVLISG